ncbi:MAG TPA: hypothetical protein VGF99_04000, partial [Myxococcota bacterium]
VAAGADDDFTIEADIPGVGTFTFSAPLPAAFVGGAGFRDNGDGLESAPVDISWTPADDDALMDLHLRANHHRRVGFSSCRLDDSVGEVTATAAIIDPLRPTTGFEGGDARRSFVGHVVTAAGCIEVAVVRSEPIFPRFE